MQLQDTITLILLEYRKLSDGVSAEKGCDKEIITLIFGASVTDRKLLILWYMVHRHPTFRLYSAQQ